MNNTGNMKDQKNKKMQQTVKSPQQTVQNEHNPKQRLIVPLLIVLTITTLVYIPVFQNQLTNWDDESYVINNPYNKSLTIQNIITNFKVFYAGNYHPLSMLSLAFDYNLGGTQPWANHLTNILLHLLNTLLVFIFCRYIVLSSKETLSYQNPNYNSKTNLQNSASDSKNKMNTGKNNYGAIIIPSITALMFGIATLNVESVAWISERKNVLYTFFFLLSCIMYVKYCKVLKSKYFIYSLVFFVLSLFSKGMAVSLAITLIAIDYVLGRNIFRKRTILEKMPFIVLSIIFGIVADYAQQSKEAMGNSEIYNLFERISFASYGFVQYLIKLIIPYKLSAFYPYPEGINGQVSPLYFLFPLVILCIIGAVCFAFKKNKLLWFGLIFFITNILLVLQIIPVGNAIMADRYAYVPSIGFFFVIGYYTERMWNNNNIRNLLVFVLAVFVLFTSYQTVTRVKVWKNSITLWSDAISRFDYENSGHICRGYAVAFNNRAEAKINSADYNGALADINIAILNDPKYKLAYNNSGIIKNELKDFAGAINDYNMALQLDPKQWEAYYNIGNLYNTLQKYQEAILNFNKAIELFPENSNIYVNRGISFQSINKPAEALKDFNKAIELSPNYYAFVNRANFKLNSGDLKGAINDYSNAITLNPNDYRLYHNRGVAYFRNNQYKEAIADMDTEINLTSNNALAYYFRGMSKINLKMKDDGCSDLLLSGKLGFSLAREQYKMQCGGSK